MKNIINTAKIFLNNKKPEIFIITGMGILAYGSIQLYRGSIKAKDIIEEAKEKIDIINEVGRGDNENYSKEDRGMDLAKTYTKTSIDLVNNIVIPSTVIIGGVFLVLYGNNIQNQRIAALTAAYTSLDATFKKYRKRVEEKYGKEIEKDIYTGRKYDKIKKDGTPKKDTKPIYDSEVGAYSVIFEKGNPNWSDNNHALETFLYSTEEYFNDILRVRGILFLGEVYEHLGFTERTQAGQVVGWLYDKNNKNIDNYVDMNIRGGLDRTPDGGVILDFNVDGVILNKIPKISK